MKTTVLKLIASAIMALSVFVLSSCKKQDDPTPPSSPVSQRIAEIQSGSDFMKFEYNADNTVKKVTAKLEMETSGETETYHVKYDGFKKITEVTYGTNQRIVPVYNNNIITRANAYEGETQTGFTQYGYQNGLLKTATVFFVLADNSAEPMLKLEFTHDAKGNVTKTDTYISFLGKELAYSGSTIYTYDDKVNPLLPNKEFLSLLWMPASPNNVLSEEVKTVEGTTESLTTYTYNYLSNRLPGSGTAVTKKSGEPDLVENMRYIYNQ